MYTIDKCFIVVSQMIQLHRNSCCFESIYQICCRLKKILIVDSDMALSSRFRIVWRDGRHSVIIDKKFSPLRTTFLPRTLTITALEDGNSVRIFSWCDETYHLNPFTVSNQVESRFLFLFLSLPNSRRSDIRL